MWPAVPMIMGGSLRSRLQLLELREEHRLISRLEAAQIECEHALGDAADDGARQRAQCPLETGETPALSLHGVHREAVARQLLGGQRPATDLTEERRLGHLVPLTERALQGRAQ